MAWEETLKRELGGLVSRGSPNGTPVPRQSNAANQLCLFFNMYIYIFKLLQINERSVPSNLRHSTGKIEYR